MDYEYKEEGQAVNQLIAIFSGLVIVAMVVIIGMVIAGKTYSVNADSLLDLNTTDPTSYTSVQTAIQNTFSAVSDSTTFIIILVLAVVGGLALMYVMGFSNAQGRGGAM
jgi:hypothetical protein